MRNKTIGLSIYRVVLTFLLLKTCLFYLPMANMLFGRYAIFPIDEYQKAMHFLGYDFIEYDFSKPYMPILFLLFMIFFGMLFLFGEFGWISGIILYVLFTILRLRNPFILDGSDNVIQVTFPFLIMSDSYRFYTLNFYKKYKLFAVILNVTKPIANFVNPFATCALLTQIAFIYFFTALAKLQGSLWLNGTAVYYTMRVAEFRATDWNIALTKNYLFVVFATYFTLLWELSFAFLIWFKQTKIWILSFGVLFHIGIFIFMRIDNFSWIMIGSYSLFINDDEYIRLNKTLGYKLKKIIKWKNLETAHM